jgi:heat shock protein HslJ
MDQERRFLELLGRFESVRITPGDELVLETGTGEELRATRG